MFEDSTHGGRQRNRAGCVGTHHFNSRPHGGRLSRVTVVASFFLFQLTPSRRATTAVWGDLTDTIISTHALTEGDTSGVKMLNYDQAISTHALTEGDLYH